MEEKSSWRQQIKKHPLANVLIALLAVVIVLIILIILGYIYSWDWTGLNATDFTSTSQNITRTVVYQPGKTLWDWLQLLIIPAVLAVAGYVINLTISRGEQAATEQRAKSEQEVAEKRAKTERDIAIDNQRELSLQTYIDNISELLLKEHLGERTADGKLKPEYEQVRNVARVRTITVLTQLDARRIGYVFTFLNEAKLMSPTFNDNAVSLGGADFHSINWTQANLSQANLYHADISNANLYHADISNASLGKANLSQANLAGADLSQAHLTIANLSQANLYHALQLHLFGGNLP